jgi:hypothetical protein
VSWAHLNDPTHWRARAIEARAIAEHISDPASKEMMLKVAAEYEHLAKRAEDRAKDSPQEKLGRKAQTSQQSVGGHSVVSC